MSLAVSDQRISKRLSVYKTEVCSVGRPRLVVWSPESRACLSSSASVLLCTLERLFLLRVLKKPIANTEHLLWCFSVIVMTFKAYVTAVMHKLTCFVSQGKVRTAIRKGGQFCYSFVENLLLYLCAKNYRNTKWFDNNKNGAIFWLHSVDLFQKR